VRPSICWHQTMFLTELQLYRSPILRRDFCPTSSTLPHSRICSASLSRPHTQGVDLSHVICAPSAANAIKTYSPDLIVHPMLREETYVVS